MVQQASWDSTTWNNQASKQPNKVTKDGKSCLDLSVSTADMIAIGSANRVTIGRYYTAFYIWYPRDSDTGWRTLHRGDNDHLVIVQNNDKNLGMYSNRDGHQFRVSISIVSSQKICVICLFKLLLISASYIQNTSKIPLICQFNFMSLDFAVPM